MRAQLLLNTSKHFSHLLRYVFCIFLCIFSGTAATDSHNKESTESPLNSFSGHCPPFISSRLYSTPTKTTLVNPSNWIAAVENSVTGEEILLEDGLYSLNQYAVVFNAPVTFRSASGNKDAVVIEGQGYTENAEALMVMANDVRIADITIKNVRDHGITIQEGFARTMIYNVDLADIGTQHIKGNKVGPHGVIACSRLGYTEEVSTGDYNGAIDLHKAIEWTIRDNYIYNIYGDGSGCAVDAECGVYFPGGEPAILLWRGSRDNVILRNTIVESFRAIALGLDTEYSGGVVKDNYICRSKAGKNGVNGFINGDTGISLSGASNVEIEGNKVILAGDYPGPIEIRDGTGNHVVSNYSTRPIWNRGNAEFNGCSAGKCNDSLYGNIIEDAPTVISCPNQLEPPVIVASLSSELSESLIANAADTNRIENQPIPEVEHSSQLDEAEPQEEQITRQESSVEAMLRQQLNEQRLLTIEAQLNAANDRLKAKEAQLQYWENQQILEDRLRIMEMQQRMTQKQFDIIQRRLDSLIGNLPH